MLTALLGAAAIAFGLMFLLWLVQQATRNAAWGDVGWAFSFGLLTAWYASVLPGNRERAIAVTVLAGLWSARLGFHLLVRLFKDHEEDGRYRHYRESWGGRIGAKFLAFFLMQGLLEFLFSAPFLLVARNPLPFPHPFEIAAAVVLAVAVAGEGLADLQLRAFKADPGNRGRTCRAGLWSVSRHPNYFFEWLVWVAWAVAASAAGGWGWAAWAAPALMLFLLVKVTGIPPAEAQAVRSRGEDYRRYQREVSAFFPWFAKASENRNAVTGDR
jgi:steroid 5-alpha reductase family enzyme